MGKLDHCWFTNKPAVIIGIASTTSLSTEPAVLLTATLPVAVQIRQRS